MKTKNLINRNFDMRQILIGVIILIVALLPLVLSNFHTELLAKFFVFAIAAISYDLIWGFAGIANFGHAVFFGLGAYTFGLVSKNMSIPGVTYVAILAAILVPALLGAFLSVFFHHGRVSGSYFAVVTMCLSVAFENIASSWTEVTGGMNGLYGFEIPKLGIPGVWEFELLGVKTPYYLIAICLGLVLLFTWHIMKRRNFGTVIAAMENDENRLRFLGTHVELLKTIIFAISCAIAGFAGALYVPVSTITPSVFSLGMSINILVWVAVGGRGSLWGPVIGAVFVCYMEELLSGVLLDFWLIIIGLIFIVVVMVWPKGIAGFIMSLEKHSFRKKKGINKQQLAIKK